MLQWLSPDSIIYNSRTEDGTVVAIIQGMDSTIRRQLSRPIACVTPDGHGAMSVNFHRLQVVRPGYGYPPAYHLTEDRYAPDDDGLWRIDLRTGRTELVLSLRKALETSELGRAGSRTWHWFDHVSYRPDGARLAVLHRWRHSSGRFSSRLVTLDPDGSDIYLLDAEHVSHFTWQNNQSVLAWASRPLGGPLSGPCYRMFQDRSYESSTIGEGLLTRDGHMTCSRDGRWILTDEYPRPHDGQRPLILYDLVRNRRIDLISFYSPPELDGELRCDLHPRFNRDANLICIDSAHRGRRQMYVIDIGQIVGQPADIG